MKGSNLSRYGLSPALYTRGLLNEHFSLID
nr:MAG TPA: hypothetical protein [Caudoviricetes sp.]